jgi:long-chain fatty acid transport protein
MISIGASFRTKSSVEMSGTAENTGFAAIGYPKESDFDRDVAWPMWIAGGIAVKPIDKLTLALDAQFSQWSESEDQFITEFNNQTWVAATTPNDQNKFILNWKDATQIRFGVEYEVNECLSLRTGIYTDPAPAPDESYNILFPSIDYTGVTLGGSYKLNQLKFELGAEYLIGKDRDIVATPHSSIPGTFGANIAAFTFGVGYEF